MRQIMLTFDVEDFINYQSTDALHEILVLLDKYEVNALFFITGQYAEHISKFPKIVNLLRKHEIGFHSSSHSVRPAIFEYCNIKSYEQAYDLSLHRETSHINPLTGEIEGRGGINSLQDLFPDKKINSFRAPGLCWSPANLEALSTLGIEFDFSAFISSEIVTYKNVTFYPYPYFLMPHRLMANRIMLNCLFRNVVILTFHPSSFANKIPWDSIYRDRNPKALLGVQSLSSGEKDLCFKEFEILLRRLKSWQKTGVVKLIYQPLTSNKNISKEKIDVQVCFERSIYWPTKHFNALPVSFKNFGNHFAKYFGKS